MPEVESDSHAILLVSLLFAVAKLACATRSTYEELQKSIVLVGTDNTALKQAVEDLGVIILTEIEPIKRVGQLFQWRCKFVEENPDKYEVLDARARTGVKPSYRDTSPRGLALATEAEQALNPTHSMHLRTSGAQGASAAGAASSAAASSASDLHLEVDAFVDDESDGDEASPDRTPMTPAAQAAAAGSAYSTAAIASPTKPPTVSLGFSPLV